MGAAGPPPPAAAAAGKRRAASRDALSAAFDVEDSRPLLSGKRPAALEPALPPSRAAVVVCAALAVLYCAAYATSLQGGAHSRDLQFINAHLNAIAQSLVLSILSFTAFLWAAQLLGAAAWPARAGLAAVHVLFLAWDHGNDFQAHGLYNWLLVLVVTVPLNSVLLGLFLWYTSLRPRNFALSFLGSGLLAGLAIWLSLMHYQRLAAVGFWGRSMAPGCAGPHCPPGSEPNCNFPATLPWIDLLPRGAQNFWTGSQHCKRIHGFEASLSPAGLFTITGCPPHALRSYTPLPNTRLWSTEQKTHGGAAYQTNVLRAMKAEPYSQPVSLSNQTEAVLARCGDAERLLTRVAARLSRDAPEPPLLLLGGASGNGSSGSSEGGKDGGKDGGSKGGKQAAAAGPVQGQGGGPERLNVLIVFIDSLGRRQFFRRMPQSAKALEEVAASGNSRLYQFFRYHVTGFHTDPNTHVMYAGSPYEDHQAQPFWHSFRRAGYVSGSAYNLCEDWGAEYDQLQAPHDHELVAPFCLPEYHPVTPDGEPYEIFKGAFSILRRCLRGRHVHEYSLQYARQFIDAYDGKAPWVFTATFHESHEGTGEVIATVDGDLASFYLSLSPSLLNRTAVITVADHGATMGLNYLLTPNGRITEHKIPMLALLLPPWLESRYPAAAAALAANEQRLLSGYDFFATLHHLLHLGESPEPPQEQYERWREAGNVTKAVRWGVSLLDEIPAGRTCSQVGVPAEWCQCFPPR